jgi:hypothetical protein
VYNRRWNFADSQSYERPICCTLYAEHPCPVAATPYAPLHEEELAMDKTLPGRSRLCALVVACMAGGMMSVTLAADNPSDEPVTPGLPPALPATGAALTPTPFEPAQHVFGRLDTGRTGYLTREQVATLERFPFDAADTNHDGRLSSDEFARAWGLYNRQR